MPHMCSNFPTLLRYSWPNEHVVDVLHLERKVVQAGPVIPHAEEGMVINIIFAGINPAELTYDFILIAGINVVRRPRVSRNQRTVSWSSVSPGRHGRSASHWTAALHSYEHPHGLQRNTSERIASLAHRPLRQGPSESQHQILLSHCRYGGIE